jgi:preprotein translocase subunit SecG
VFTIVLAVHFILCASLIGIVLLQQGRGADAGATFAGGANTVFGSSGATTVLTKATTIIAILFMVTSILLVLHYPSSFLAGSTLDPLAGSAVLDQKAPVAASAGVEVVPNAAPGTDNPVSGNSANGDVPVTGKVVPEAASPAPAVNK